MTTEQIFERPSGGRREGGAVFRHRGDKNKEQLLESKGRTSKCHLAASEFPGQIILVIRQPLQALQLLGHFGWKKRNGKERGGGLSGLRRVSARLLDSQLRHILTQCISSSKPPVCFNSVVVAYCHSAKPGILLFALWDFSDVWIHVVSP